MKNLILFFFLLSNFAYAQNDSIKKWSLSFYGEIYYSYDFSEPQNHEKPSFIYNHKRHNEFNANLILGKLNFADDKVRANLGVMLGNYPQYNLAAEPELLRNIYEANIGIKLSRNQNFWLDVGILPSHIGFESAVGADNYTLTRSLVAENSPYFETGAKLSYTSKYEKITVSGLVLNGWQRIKRPDGMQKPSFGFQFNYKPNENLNFNYSNFIGSDSADSEGSSRFYHNFYSQINATNHLSFIAGVDMGIDKISNNNKIWYAPILITQYKFNNQHKMAVRTEFFSDKDNRIFALDNFDGAEMLGISTNYDYSISRFVLFRTEFKHYKASQPIFFGRKNNIMLTTALSFKF